jgi:hypothetical protein
MCSRRANLRPRGLSKALGRSSLTRESGGDGGTSRVFALPADSRMSSPPRSGAPAAPGGPSAEPLGGGPGERRPPLFRGPEGGAQRASDQARPRPRRCRVDHPAQVEHRRVAPHELWVLSSTSVRRGILRRSLEAERAEPSNSGRKDRASALRYSSAAELLTRGRKGHGVSTLRDRRSRGRPVADVGLTDAHHEPRSSPPAACGRHAVQPPVVPGVRHA